ncbi:MBL fold metallo-hydrolase [Antarcticibacterium arcticum]|uniref:MBL fold metallo-hydrolase n=1 Tax=Antarcticibacterium arcticum TaxID=2585771 RepID=A0A5B8YF89_9FLAO|nr:MBL fold metallo-hydrolase [Antarcticibacterium arcticum]QED36575.1 MBL fold metallo-hydrolase [Antarcticibacterium arcticum]
MEVKVHFLGASGTVTGSKFVVETPGYNVMVDCGMFQGLKELRLLNWDPLDFPASQIDAVLLTHGHLDHTGYLPRLVLQGFKGPIIGTAPTLAIAAVIMEDSAKIQEEDAERANNEGYSIHDPAEAFYTTEDVQQTIRLFKHTAISEWVQLAPGIKYKYEKNGHILGACYIEFDIYGKIFLFSGDIGRDKDLLLEAPVKPEWADFIFMESTYGNRLHPENDTEVILTEAIKETIEKRGSLIIPSFAVERMQTLMYILFQLYKKKKIPHIPIFIDSPMGNKVYDIFRNFSNWHKLNAGELNEMQEHFNVIKSFKETWDTIDDKRAKVVIAGSGMVTGGRVLTYLKYAISNPTTILILVGFQAEGTRGRELQEGVHEIKIFGEYLPVKAKVMEIQSLSAHADQQELLDWLSHLKNIPEKIFLIHGEEPAADSLRLKIKDTYNWKTHQPKLNEVVSFKFEKEIKGD